MKKSSNTKRAFLASILSLLLCMAMLIGSTFAWFTDSVTTGKNTIVAGNLDVELYSRQLAEGSTEYEYVPVSAKQSLFDNDALWEPGHTEVVYLKVANLGSLALKYKLAVTVEDETEGTNVAGDTFKLSDYLVFGQAVGTTETLYVDRAAAQAAVAGRTQGLDSYFNESVLYPAGTDGEASEEYVALVVYMPESVGNEANYKTGTKAPTITLGVTLVATQTPYESDSFDDKYDENVAYPVYVSSNTELRKALEEGGSIVLDKDITLTKTTITKDADIDLNGHTLKGSSLASNIDVLSVQDATVTVKNGTLDAPAVRKEEASALFVTGDSYVTVENCTLKTNSNKSFTVVTNGAESLESTIVIKNSTISAPNVTGKKGYAAFIPAGNVTFENCNLTGHVFICGGNVTLDGGIYTATGFNDQSKIWDKEDTISYVSFSMPASGASTMGDSIFIADRRSGYELTGLTIRNITFNTEISVGTAYAIKYVDMNKNGAENRVPYVIENNTFNQQIDGGDPVMYIDLDGNDISDP